MIRKLGFLVLMLTFFGDAFAAEVMSQAEAMETRLGFAEAEEARGNKDGALRLYNKVASVILSEPSKRCTKKILATGTTRLWTTALC